MKVLVVKHCVCHNMSKLSPEKEDEKSGGSRITLLNTAPSRGPQYSVVYGQTIILNNFWTLPSDKFIFKWFKYQYLKNSIPCISHCNVRNNFTNKTIILGAIQYKILLLSQFRGKKTGFIDLFTKSSVSSQPNV